jgi:hypothetical protein
MLAIAFGVDNVVGDIHGGTDEAKSGHRQKDPHWRKARDAGEEGREQDEDVFDPLVRPEQTKVFHQKGSLTKVAWLDVDCEY